ncbi:MAG TPA: DUF5615 family PIN-like protein [Blastocatellia bacterium]|nr:DUF5615 family PIN-like protein [Blastocatellia bacterium]
MERQIVARLRQEGHEALYVAEMEPGISDDLVLNQANERGALLVTADKDFKDFGELVFRQSQIAGGVLLLRLAGLSNKMKAEIVATALREHAEELIQAFAVLSPNNIRIRKRQL